MTFSEVLGQRFNTDDDNTEDAITMSATPQPAQATDDDHSQDILAGSNLYFVGLRPGEVVELRTLTAKGAAKSSGYFDSPQAMAVEAGRLNRNGENVYAVINPCPAALAVKGVNRVDRAGTGECTADSMVLRRKLVLFDFDKTRGAGAPAKCATTKEEMAAALSEAKEFASGAEMQGWPAPVWCKSGNGYHLIYAVDLPGDKDTDDLVHAVLVELKKRYPCIDRTVGSRAQLSRFYGTINRKGENTADRPHRQSRIMPVGADNFGSQLLTREQLQAVLPVAQAQAAKTNTKATKTASTEPVGPGEGFDMLAFCNRHSIKMGPAKDHKGGLLWEVPCQWCAGHDGSQAYVGVTAKGLPYAKCHGNRCAGNGWREFKQLFEPGSAETDQAVAETYSEHYADEVRYCCDEDMWLGWDGQRWAESRKGQQFTKLHEMVKLKRKLAADVKDADEAKRWAKYNNNGPATAAITTAKAIPALAVMRDDFDLDPWLLNVQNGTLDLRTGQLKEHSPGDNLSKIANVHFDPDAKCPRWDRFMDEIMAGDRTMVDYLRRCIGYALTGDAREQAVFFLHGRGANGKSIWLQTFADLLGEYSVAADAAAFADQRDQSGSRPELISIRRARYIPVAELSKKNSLNVALLKQWTGGDTLAPRDNYKGNVNFRAAGKLFLYANEKPPAQDASDGFWRRLHLIKFGVDFRDRMDLTLKDKLLAEMSGILNWALAGCIEWQKLGGLRPPQQIADAVEAYREEQDPVGEFLQEECTIDPDAWATKDALFLHFDQWSKSHGKDKLTPNLFSRAMISKGFKANRPVIDGRKTSIWEGVCSAWLEVSR